MVSSSSAVTASSICEPASSASVPKACHCGEKRMRYLFSHQKSRNWVRDDTHQEKQKDDGRRLQVRAESQQTAIAILHHKLPLVPWHVAQSPSEFHALGGVLGIQCVGIFNEQVRIEQFVPVFVRVGCGRLGAAAMNDLR